MRKPREYVLHGEIGAAPELDVRAGAVARRQQAPMLDTVAPQLVVLQSRGAHRLERPPERVGRFARSRPELRLGPPIYDAREPEKQQVYLAPPDHPGRVVGVLRE